MKHITYPLSSREAFHKNLDIGFFILLAAFFIILVRVGLLQLSDLYRTSAEQLKDRLEKKIWVIPPRGEILDRNGRLLATSLSLKTIVMDPYKLRTLPPQRRKAVFIRVENLLNLPMSDLNPMIENTSALTAIKTGINAQAASEIKQYKKRGFLPGIEIVGIQERIYPLKENARALLGKIKDCPFPSKKIKNENPGLDYWEFQRKFPWYASSSIKGATPQVGFGGVEAIFNQHLSGLPYQYRIRLDRNMETMERFIEPVAKGKIPGSIQLSLHSNLQNYVAKLTRQNLIEKKAGLGMSLVMDTPSGEILAAYSVSLSGDRIIPDDSQIITSSFEAGSVAKPLLMLYALRSGAIRDEDLFNCNLSVRLGDKIYKDEHTFTTKLSPREILAFSSDSGMVQIIKRTIALKGDAFKSDLFDFLKSFGLGQSLEIHHTAIPKSNLPSPENWSKITPAQFSLGYEFTMSPFHLIKLYAALIGENVRPILVKNLLDDNGKIFKTFHQSTSNNIRNPDIYSELIYDYLKSVVSLEKGTGRRAAIQGYNIAGKTGTARRFIKGSYSRSLHQSSFIGILPRENGHRHIIGVFFRDIKKGSHYGGTACAPVFKKIAQFIIDEGIP